MAAEGVNEMPLSDLARKQPPSIFSNVPRFRFIEPCQPVLRDRPPTGSDWIRSTDDAQGG